MGNGRGREKSKGRRTFTRRKNSLVKAVFNGRVAEVGERLFQLVIMDYSRRRNGYREVVVVREGNTRKKITVLPELPTRTVVRPFPDHKAAMRWGRGQGNVISCQKVNMEAYLNNIEHLNLGEPRAIEIVKDEFVLGEDVQIVVDKE